MSPNPFCDHDSNNNKKVCKFVSRKDALTEQQEHALEVHLRQTRLRGLLELNMGIEMDGSVERAAFGFMLY